MIPLKEALGLLGLNDENFHIITSQYDFAKLLRVTETICCRIPGYTDKELKYIKGLFTNCKKINDARNRIAHGTWYVSGEAMGTESVSRQNLKYQINFEDVKEIHDIIGTIENCKNELSKFTIGRLRRLRV